MKALPKTGLVVVPKGGRSSATNRKMLATGPAGATANPVNIRGKVPDGKMGRMTSKAAPPGKVSDMTSRPGKKMPRNT